MRPIGLSMALAAALGAAGCGDQGTATATLGSLDNTPVTASLQQNLWRWARAPLDWLVSTAHAQSADPCQMPGVTCEAPTELSIRIQDVYLVYDLAPDGMTNIGPPSGQNFTQAIYASAQCPRIETTPGVYGQPDLRSCTIADFVNLAKSPAEVKAALSSGSYTVLPGTYKYVRLASSDPTSGTNVRFQSATMPSPYELASSIVGGGVIAKFATPLVVNAGDKVEVDLHYDLSKAVEVIPSTQGVNNNICTPMGATNYHCFDPANLKLVPVVKVNGAVVQ
jgi:hypothetical protein